jgi:hypothetical protein
MRIFQSFLGKSLEEIAGGAMSSIPVGTDQFSLRHNRRAAVQPPVSRRLRIAGACLRATFIILLLIATVHASLPQSESLWTIYDTPADLVRLAMGLAVGAWAAIQLFTLPKDDQAFRTWFYVGLLAIPFLIICIVATW